MGQGRRLGLILLAACGSPSREPTLGNRTPASSITVRLARANELPRTQTCAIEGDFAADIVAPVIAFARAELVDADGELVTTRVVRPDEASIITAQSGVDIAIQPRAHVGNLIISWIFPTSIASATYCLHVREHEIVVERR